MNMNNLIARAMCEVLAETVWPHVQQIVHHEHRKAIRPLVAKVGNGSKTFHTIKNNKHQITFGPDRVQKLQNFRVAHSSFGGREIKKYGYYDDITYPSSLAHMVVHEASHAIQRALGLRVPGKVHDKDYYKVLSELHSRCGDKALEAMTNKMLAYGANLDFDPDSFKVLPDGQRVSSGPEIKEDNTVAFMHKGRRNLSVIMEPGDKTSGVYVYAGANAGDFFDVANCNLEDLNEDDRRPDFERDIPKKIPWQKGDHCHFYQPDMTYMGGQIVKANKRQCKVLITLGHPRLIGSTFRVPRHILHEGNKLHPSRNPEKGEATAGMSL